jgi:hypothetical protein
VVFAAVVLASVAIGVVGWGALGAAIGMGAAYFAKSAVLLIVIARVFAKRMD